MIIIKKTQPPTFWVLILLVYLVLFFSCFLSLFCSIQSHTSCMCRSICINGSLPLINMAYMSSDVLQHHCDSSLNVCVISVHAQSCEAGGDKEGLKLRRWIMNIVEKWWIKDFPTGSGCYCCATTERPNDLFLMDFKYNSCHSEKKNVFSFLNISVVKFELVIIWPCFPEMLTKTIAIGEKVIYKCKDG